MITFRCWFLKRLAETIKDFWFIWIPILILFITLIISEYFLPNSAAMDASGKGMLMLFGFFGGIYVVLEILLRISNYKDNLYEKYQEEIKNESR